MNARVGTPDLPLNSEKFGSGFATDSPPGRLATK